MCNDYYLYVLRDRAQGMTWESVRLMVNLSIEDDGTHHLSLTTHDKDLDLRNVPSEEILELAKFLQDYLNGTID